MNITQLILIQVITFIFIVVFLKLLLQSHISRAVTRLQKLNQQSMQKEKILQEEIERARKGADLEIERRRQEGDAVIKSAKETAEKIRAGMLDKSEEEAKRITEEALKDIKRKQAGLIFEIQNKAVHIATEMIRYIFTEKVLKNLHMGLIDEVISDIGSLDDKHFESFHNGGGIEVISAYPLDDGQRKKLEKILSSKLGKDIKFSEEIKEDLVGGIVIKMGGFIIDGSVENKFRKVIPIMAEKFRLKAEAVTTETRKNGDTEKE